MMMDWGMIVTAVLGIVGGGAIMGFLLLKQTKSSATADALNKYADWSKEIMDQMVKQQQIFNDIIKTKDEETKGLREQVRELNLRVAENERKVAGMQRTIDNEIRLRKTAESNICFVTDCELRKPRLGTYNKE